MKQMAFLLGTLLMAGSLSAQHSSKLPAEQWVDSVFRTLTPDQKIGQLMILRTSGLKNGQVVWYDQQVAEAVKKYNIGGICLFQGGPQQQAMVINRLQSMAQTPLLVTVDGEWGLGMRFDSVQALPRQMTLGAMSDPTILYDFGKIVADQCRRIGIQVNYAPVVDVNNNPDNPVINDRSFGENKYRVTTMALQYMKGLQDHGVMATAKHFPGHGDVSVDSHVDLPVVNKTRAQLDSLELYPFKALIDSGVASVMIGHLSVPTLDDRDKRPSSLSDKVIKGLLRTDLGFKGLTFTDALEMQAVAKYFPKGESSAQSLIAGNDLLCLPENVEESMARIKKAIKKKKLSWTEIDAKVKKVLLAKYQYGLANWQPVELHHLTEDLNKDLPALWHRVAEEALTLLRNEGSLLPLPPGGNRRVAFVGIGLSQDNRFAERMRRDYKAQTYYFDYTMDSVQADALLAFMRNRYDVVIAGVHNYNRRPAGNFGISNAAIYLLNRLQQQHQLVTAYFGNPYAIRNSKDNSCLLAAYEDDNITQETTADLINGKFQARGTLPVTVSANFPGGAGILEKRLLPDAWPGNLGLDYHQLQSIDSICENAIAEKAIPGCVVLVARDGKIAYEKSFGHYAYNDSTLVNCETIYDMASVTKIMATTLSVMKLYDEGKLSLDKTLGDYLPWTRGTNKAGLVIREVLLHEAGLKAFIPFFKETIDPVDGAPNMGIYANQADSLHPIRVAETLYMRKDWNDTLYKRILQSELTEKGKYIYSDNDFIFMGKIVEAITGKSLDSYVRETFYEPLGLHFTGFKPLDRFPKSYMAPTEDEPVFRRQLLQGDVHDPGAAMFGGVAGHAGLFSDAYDLAVLAQMLQNKGTLNGIIFYKPSTLDLFTAYGSANSRRGLGFDKPEKDNATRPEPYPCASATPATFGHTGFTGTCVWIDPVYHLTFIFLSNRVNNNGDPNKFLRMNVRPKIQEVIYRAMGK